jgi:hypothetical protein
MITRTRSAADSEHGFYALMAATAAAQVGVAWLLSRASAQGARRDPASVRIVPPAGGRYPER